MQTVFQRCSVFIYRLVRVELLMAACRYWLRLVRRILQHRAQEDQWRRRRTGNARYVPHSWQRKAWRSQHRRTPVRFFTFFCPILSQARFPFKRNRLRCVRCVRCVNENHKKRKRLRWQATSHGCHCFDRAFLLAGACVCCVKIRKRLRFLRFSFTQRTQRTQHKRLRLNGNRASPLYIFSLILEFNATFPLYPRISLVSPYNRRRVVSAATFREIFYP